eukprot:tig00000681_g3137.t1
MTEQAVRGVLAAAVMWARGRSAESFAAGVLLGNGAEADAFVGAGPFDSARMAPKLLELYGQLVEGLTRSDLERFIRKPALDPSCSWRPPAPAFCRGSARAARVYVIEEPQPISPAPVPPAATHVAGAHELAAHEPSVQVLQHTLVSDRGEPTFAL